MAKRRARSGRFTKGNSPKRRNKYKNALNIPEAAIGLITVNAATQSLFGTNIVQFLTQGWDGKAEAHSWEYTLPELIGLVPGMGVWKPSSDKLGITQEEYLPYGVKRNLRKEAPAAIGGVATAMLVNFGMKKFGVYRRMNRLVRQVGIGKTVKFS
jgi:hypothetical protein